MHSERGRGCLDFLRRYVGDPVGGSAQRELGRRFCFRVAGYIQSGQLATALRAEALHSLARLRFEQPMDCSPTIDAAIFHSAARVRQRRY